MKLLFTARVRKDNALGIIYNRDFTCEVPPDREENFTALALPAIHEAGYEFHGDLRLLRTVP
jgi:hypothetical protein